MHTLRSSRVWSAAVLAALACNAPEPVASPFGVLRLPSLYTSHRISLRDRLDVGRETEVALLDGEGCLRHLWMTTDRIVTHPEEGLLVVLRVYADGAEYPSVEVPVGPFFGLHHGHRVVEIDSPYLSVTSRGGFNAYFPMPFSRGLRVTLENQSTSPHDVWLQADYQRYAAGALTEPLRFHAAYRRVNRAERYGQPYHLGHASGRGVLLGLSLGMRVFDRTDEWFHNGGDLLLLDGGTAQAHLISGIGGEDFFGTAWGQAAFSAGAIGSPYYEETPEASVDEPTVVFAAYRFFHRDPLAFAESYWYDYGSLENDISSVLYWYQVGAAELATELPPPEARLPEARAPDTLLARPEPSGLQWTVVGPFDATDYERFDRSEFPEEGIDLSRSASADFGQYALARRSADTPAEAPRTRWVSGVAARNNFVDLTPYFRPQLRTNGGLPRDVSAYAATTIEMESAGRARLRIGHDDWLKLWLNGDLLHRADARQGFGTEEIEVELRAGTNELLVKVANHDNTNFRAWVFLLDLLE